MILGSHKIMWLAALLIAGLLSACAGGAQPAAPTAAPGAKAVPSAAAPAQGAAEITLKLGHAVAKTHPYHLGAEKFAELVSQRTNGRVKVDIYDNSQLGGEREMIEAAQLGTLDFYVGSTGPWIGWLPESGAFDLPFLFRDEAHADKVLDGPIGQDLLKKWDAKGIVGLAFWENGFRNITNSKRPITKPEDLKGIKIRTMENKVHLAAFKAFGAAPTPMAWPEVFNALQQKVIDAQENPVPVIYTSKLYEVQKYLSLTGHVYSPASILMSKKSFEKLPPDVQKVVADAGREAGSYERQVSRQQATEQVALLKEKGMEVNTPDKQPFLDAAKPVYTEFEAQFGKELIQKILETK